MAGRVTLAEIARQVGVSKSTVSDVLSNRNGRIGASEQTRKRILKTARSLNYHPQAAARALATGRTQTIGFLLSNKITQGLANSYFSQIASGVHDACKDRGYGCMVGVHDLSSVKDFAIPSKIRSRSIDGMVICGYVEPEIVQVFVDYNIPFVLVGESTEYPRDGIISVMADMVQLWQDIFEYLHRLGHRHFVIGGYSGRSAEALVEQAQKEFRQKHSGNGLRFASCRVDAEVDQFQAARRAGVEWTQKSTRPTAVVGHAYWCAGFLSSILGAGFSCPDDLSVFSTTDGPLCQLYYPPISALSAPMQENGRRLADLLVDVVEEKMDVRRAQEQAKDIWTRGELIVRGSCGPPPEMGQ